MEFKYDVYVVIHGERRRSDGVVGTASLSKRLENVVFPNPVAEGMRVNILLNSKSGLITLNGDANFVTNISRYKEEGFSTTFNLHPNVSLDRLEQLREDLEDSGFVYRTD